jgi:hypothetical protein
MKQKKTNTFGVLWYIGLTTLGLPVVIVLVLVGLAFTHKSSAVPLAKPNSDNKNEKVIEKVYIHDTVEIPCRRKHCDEHVVKKPETKQADSTPITTKPDTLK